MGAPMTDAQKNGGNAVNSFSDRKAYEEALAKWQAKKAAGDPFPGPMPRLDQIGLAALDSAEEEKKNPTPPPAPDLADKLLQGAGANSLLRQKAKQGRRSTFLSGATEYK